MSARSLSSLLLAAGLTASAAFAQFAISAKSGLINFVEGAVLLDGTPVDVKPGGMLPQMPEGGLLETKEGRAEVLLTPGVFLRVAENSSWRLVTNRLIDTRLELLSGSIIVEVAELLKDNNVTLVYKDSVIGLKKDGLYRLDATAGLVRVYDGEAAVEAGGQDLTLKKGRELALEGAGAPEKFDAGKGDALFRWSRRRAEYLAVANLSAAKNVHDRSLNWNSSSWLWNPYFGMFTYVPVRGLYRSFWGYSFYSPREAYIVFNPPMRQAWFPDSAGSGYRTMPQTSAGTSGAMARGAAAPTTQSSAPTATVPRTSGSAGGRTR